MQSDPCNSQRENYVYLHMSRVETLIIEDIRTPQIDGYPKMAGRATRKEQTPFLRFEDILLSDAVA